MNSGRFVSALFRGRTKFSPNAGEACLDPRWNGLASGRLQLPTPAVSRAGRKMHVKYLLHVVCVEHTEQNSLANWQAILLSDSSQVQYLSRQQGVKHSFGGVFAISVLIPDREGR